jgi:hypothetical protein
MNKIRLPQDNFSDSRTNYINFEIELDMYPKKMQTIVFLKFIKILKTKNINIIARADNTLQVYKKHLSILNKEYKMFKSLCFKLRKNAKIECSCEDKMKCRLLDCSCECHKEEKYFNTDYTLNNYQKVEISLKEYGPKDPMTKIFIEHFRKTFSETQRINLCDCCMTFNNPACRNCKMHVKYEI